MTLPGRCAFKKQRAGARACLQSDTGLLTHDTCDFAKDGGHYSHHPVKCTTAKGPGAFRGFASKLRPSPSRRVSFFLLKDVLDQSRRRDGRTRRSRVSALPAAIMAAVSAVSITR